MKKMRLVLLLSCCIYCGGCLDWWVGERNPEDHIAWGGGAFVSPKHQQADVGFYRAQGEGNEYSRGVSFQFPSFGLYGGNDHTSIGVLVGVTIFYGKDKYLTSKGE